MPDPIYSEHNKSTPVNFQNTLFFGQVTGTDPATFVVQVAPAGQRNRSIIQGVPLSSCMAHMLGFKESSLPQIGAYVLCYPASANHCIILGVIPKPDELDEEGQMPFRTLIGAGDGMNDEQNSQGYTGDLSKIMNLNMQRPTDVVEGEKVISNEFGVLLGLFQQFAVLKASELAQVQTHVLDDLVRIVSHNFQHYSCLGEYKIYHDGKRLHLEAGLTDDPKEALGIPQPSEENPNQNITHNGDVELDDTKNFYELESEQLQAIERLKIFIGTLGDFVNIMLVRPPDDQNTLRKSNGEDIEAFDRGLFSFQLHKDGGLHVRSIKGISLEKTNWIRVPHRIRTPEDPAGDDGATIEYEEKEAFTFDDNFKYEEQPFLYFLQIRDYLAYMQEEYALKNFNTHEKDFQINNEFEEETKLDEIQKVDPFSKTKYEKRTSGISLMPNGGIMFYDAWGSSFVMEGGNIYIQPAKDLIMQPLRNMVGKVGQFVSIAAKKDIDLSSTEGGYRLKTDKAQYMYSDHSGIVMHAEGVESPNFFPSEDDEAAEIVSGIVLKAPNTGIFNYSRFKTDRVTERAISYYNEYFLKSDGNLIISAKGDMAVQTTGAIAMGGDKSITIASEKSAYLLGKTSTIVGLDDQTFATAKFGPLGRLPVQGLIKQQNINSIFDFNDKLVDLDIMSFSPNFRKDEEFDDLKFKFLNSSKYNLTDIDAIPQTIAQQEDASFEELHSLVEWEETAINDTYPYPGKGHEDFYIVSSLLNLDQQDKELHNKAEDLALEATLEEPINIFQDYKVKE